MFSIRPSRTYESKYGFIPEERKTNAELNKPLQTKQITNKQNKKLAKGELSVSEPREGGASSKML